MLRCQQMGRLPILQHSTRKAWILDEGHRAPPQFNDGVDGGRLLEKVGHEEGHWSPFVFRGAPVTANSPRIQAYRCTTFSDRTGTMKGGLEGAQSACGSFSQERLLTAYELLNETTAAVVGLRCRHCEYLRIASYHVYCALRAPF